MFVEDEETVAAPTAGAASLVLERLRGEGAMALSLSCDLPGADVIDLVSSSCVVGTFNGIARAGGIVSDDAGGSAVADGMTTSLGRGTVMVGCAGTAG